MLKGDREGRPSFPNEEVKLSVNDADRLDCGA